jgi:hypothetical protein
VYRRVSSWVVAAGIAACVTAYVWPARDTAMAPAAATASAAATVSVTSGNAWFSAALLAPHPAATPEQEPARPLVARNGRIVDLGGLDVAQYIAQREGAARLGDMKAIYEVYQAEALCANLDAPLPDLMDDADREQLTRARTHQRALCSNVSPAQVQERLHYLKLAADAGNADAQIDFAMEAPATLNADDPAVAQWKQDAIGYLKAAGMHCNAYALGLLSNAYDAGSLAEPNPVLAMAYNIASARARSIEKTPAQWAQQFGEGMSDADVDAALKQGMQLADGACRRPE